MTDDWKQLQALVAAGHIPAMVPMGGGLHAGVRLSPEEQGLRDYAAKCEQMANECLVPERAAEHRADAARLRREATQVFEGEVRAAMAPTPRQSLDGFLRSVETRWGGTMRRLAL